MRRLPSGICYCPDRMGLKERLIRGLWLTQARGRGGFGMRGEPAAAEAGVTLHQPEVRRAFSRGSCPWITGPWQWRAAQASGRAGVDSDLSLHTGFLVAAAAVSCPSLGSEVIAAARAHLWSSFRRCSTFCGQRGKESPLLAHPETVVSCLFVRSRLLPGLPPG